MANYVSKHTGEQIDTGVDRGQHSYIPNILLNSNWENPINYGGQKTMSSPTVGDEFISGWRAATSACNTSVATNGITFIDGGAYNILYQTFPLSEFVGKTVTMACCDTNGNITVGYAVFPASGTSLVVASNDVTQAFLSYDSYYGDARFRVGITHVAPSNVTIKWVAAYMGAFTKETLPDYIPPNPREEWVKLGQPTNPTNLLDNSNFLNPINQRGFVSNTRSGEYTIDRWMCESGDHVAGTVSLNSNGITLTPPADNYCGIFQLLECYGALKGKTCTVAIYADGVSYVTAFEMGATSTGGILLDNGLRVYSLDNLHLLIRNLEGDGAITVQKVALYEGTYTADTLPPYVPKPYSVELAECQRYFYRFDASTNAMYIPCMSGGTQIAGFLFPTEMRAIPTMTINSLKSWLPSTGFTDISGNISSKRCTIGGLQYIDMTSAFSESGLIYLIADFSADVT